MPNFAIESSFLGLIMSLLIQPSTSLAAARDVDHAFLTSLLTNYSDRDCTVSEVQNHGDRTEFTIRKGNNGFKATINSYSNHKAKFTGEDSSDEYEFEGQVRDGQLRSFRVEVYRYTYSTNSGKSDWRILANSIECGR